MLLSAVKVRSRRPGIFEMFTKQDPVDETPVSSVIVGNSLRQLSVAN